MKFSAQFWNPKDRKYETRTIEANHKAHAEAKASGIAKSNGWQKRTVTVKN